MAELGLLYILNTADRKMLIEQYGPERVMDALYEYFRDNGGETGFVHSKDVAEAEKEIKRYVAFRTGRVAELAKAAQPSERPGIWLSYAAQKSGAKAIATGLENAAKVVANSASLDLTRFPNMPVCSTCHLLSYLTMPASVPVCPCHIHQAD